MNTELLEASSRLEACQESMANLEAQITHAENRTVSGQAEKEELFMSYRSLHDGNSQLLGAVQARPSPLSY